MRKVLVCGAAFAATCIAAVAVPGGAQAAPDTPSAEPTLPALIPDSPAAPAPSDGGTRSPSTPPTSGGGQAAPTGGPDVIATASAVMVTPEPPKASTYAYGDHERQRLDAYWRPGTQEEPGQGDTGPAGRRQEREEPGPAVLVFHGGSWISGDKSSWKYFARRLTNKGYTVFSANYRLAQHAPWPAQRNDAMAALGFIKENAAKWNIDPDRIVAFGSSAGGLLAAQLGTYGRGADRVRGVVALSPVNTPYLAYQDGLKPDATDSQRYVRRAVIKLVDCVPSSAADPACLQRIEDANAAAHAGAGDAPALFMHAEEEFVPATHSTGLVAALKSEGVPAKARTVSGDGHASELLNDPGTYPALLDWIKTHTS